MLPKIRDSYPKLNDEAAYGRQTRRELLKLAPLLAVPALFLPRVQMRVLASGMAWNDRFSRAAFSPGRNAPVFSDSELTPLERFPYNYYLALDPEVDLEKWTLQVDGKVARPGDYTLSQILDLPKRQQNTKHICIEGWEVIGSFGGARLSDFLAYVGADLSATHIEVDCADDYYESIDMPSALHPQTLLCYEMYGQPLNRGHGAPVRLQIPTKLGYKQAKFLTALRVTNVLSGRRGYWEDRGYPRHGGI